MLDGLSRRASDTASFFPANDVAAVIEVKSKLDGRELKREARDARIKLAPDPKIDDLPMTLPEGWAAQSLENLFLFIDYRGNTPPKTGEGVPLITAKNVRRGYLNREPREYISRTTFENWMTRGLPEIGDLQG